MSQDHWQNEDIPAVCDSCLGSNPYLEMQRERQGEECKLCTRPFTVFRWNTSRRDHKYKRTVICWACSRAKNCCQCCMLDLTYGIDLQTRDAVLKLAGVKSISDPVNVISKQYVAEGNERKFKEQSLIEGRKQIGELVDEEEAKRQKAIEMLSQIAQKSAIKTQATETKKVTRSKRDQQQAKQKYTAVELMKAVGKLPFNGSLLMPPKDETVKSFFVFGITEDVSEYMVREIFERNFGGAVEVLVLNHKAGCGFVSFKARSIAESVAQRVLQHQSQRDPKFTSEAYKFPCLVMVGSTPVRVAWGKVRTIGTNNADLDKIHTVVLNQMKVYAEKDLGNLKGTSSKRRRNDDDDSNENKKIPPVGGNVHYKSMKASEF